MIHSVNFSQIKWSKFSRVWIGTLIALITVTTLIAFTSTESHAQTVAPSVTPSSSTAEIAAQTDRPASSEYRLATDAEKQVIITKLGEEKLNTLAEKALEYNQQSLKSLMLKDQSSSTQTLKLAPTMQVRVPMNFDPNHTEQEGKPLFQEIYISWGYHRGYHGVSDVQFKTPEGTFTVHDAAGKDRPTPFTFDEYFNPKNISIPQYNLEIGFMFNSKWGIELQHDHMKWVFDNKRPYEMSGEYDHLVAVKNADPSADWDSIEMVPFSEAKARKDGSWMAFEHSDGYNYPSIGVVRKFDLYSTKNNAVAVSGLVGGGVGLMIPKTKVMFHQDQAWNWEGLDNKFHIAGGGAHLNAKLRVTLLTKFYVQAVARGTYIKVKDALVDGSESRMEHLQPISSIQFIGQVGYIHTLKKKSVKKPEIKAPF
jgi:hypothetical protein